MAYVTSDLYKEAIEKDSRVTFIDGELVTETGTVIQLSNEMIDQGSFYVTNQCVSSDAFSYGSVFAAESGITLKTEINRYSLYDAKIKPFFNILLSDGTYERIPLGVFFVNDPSRVGKNVVIKAYDQMIDLETDITENVTGTPYELLVYISEQCNIQLAQVEADFSSFANQDVLLSVGYDRVGTYRDLLSYICMVTCSFAAFDRFGKLKLYQFGLESVKTIQTKNRTSSKFSDFESYFSFVKADFISENAYKTYAQGNDTYGLTYEMGEIPVVQGVDDTNQAVINSIFAKLQNVRYTPCDISFNGDPALDLGDVITNIDRFGNEIKSIVTFYKWSYRGGHQIKCAGQNPKLLKKKSSASKEMAVLKAEVKAKEVVVYSYTNAKTLVITDKEVEVVNFIFATIRGTKPIIIATIPFTMNMDGNVVLKYYLNDMLVKEDTISEYLLAGDHFLTVSNHLTIPEATIYTYKIKMCTEFVESNERKNDAKVTSILNFIDAQQAYDEQERKKAEEETGSGTGTGESGETTPELEPPVYTETDINRTIPTVTIASMSVKAVLYAQGLETTIPWDGNINVEDTIQSVYEVAKLPDIELLTRITEEVSFKHFPGPRNSVISDTIPSVFTFEMPTISFIPGKDSVEVGRVTVAYLLRPIYRENYEYDSTYLYDIDTFRLRKEYINECVEEPIDEGRMEALTIDLSSFVSVEKVEVTNYG